MSAGEWLGGSTGGYLYGTGSLYSQMLANKQQEALHRLHEDYVNRLYPSMVVKEYKTELLDNEMCEPTRKTFRQQLQAETDEWLKGI